MNLYEIDEAIMSCVDMDTGEIVDENALTALQMERDSKVENIALWIKNLMAEAAALKREQDSFRGRRAVAENKAASLKKYLSEYLAGEKFKTTRVNISYRKSESVEVSDWKEVPEEFLKPNDPDVDKTGLKNALKNGLKCSGAALVTKKNIQIR